MYRYVDITVNKKSPKLKGTKRERKISCVQESNSSFDVNKICIFDLTI